MASALAVPRRIDKTIERIARARSHARTASNSRRRRKALTQLRKMRLTLEQLQARTIDDSLPSLDELEPVLVPIEDALKAFMKKKPRRRRLRKLAKRMRRFRRGVVS